MKKIRISLCFTLVSIMAMVWLNPAISHAQQAKPQGQAATATLQNKQSTTYGLVQNNKGINLVNGKKTIPVSSNPNDSNAVMLDDEVYFIRQQKNVDAPTALMAYSISSKKLSNRLNNLIIGSTYNKKFSIFKLIADNQNKRLYLCSGRKTANGYMEIMTWCYNKTTGKFEAYRDGEIDHIDQNGNQTFYFQNHDNKGTYNGGIVLDINNKKVQELPRTYTKTSVK
jgi:hypothetical protein